MPLVTAESAAQFQTAGQSNSGTLQAEKKLSSFLTHRYRVGHLVITDTCWSTYLGRPTLLGHAHH
jgi:hypothetical protein